MADTLSFEDVLKVVKENNPKLLEAWKDRKISGARTILDSKLRRKVVDEVRFKLKGGAQIAFIGDDDQEKLVKIVGGKEKAKKSLDYIKKMTEENGETLSDEDRAASDILTTSLEKYIKILEARQIERNRVKTNKVPTVAEMQETMARVDESDKSDKEKQKEKEDYMRSMQEKYQRELDILKHKLEGIRLKLADKKVLTKQGENGVEVRNFEALNNLYEQFQALTMSVYDYGQAYSFVQETLEGLKKQKAVPSVPHIEKPKKKEEPEEKKKLIIDVPDTPKVMKFQPVITDGEIAYNYGRYRDKVWMKRTALEMDLESGKRKETIFTKSPLIRSIISFLPNRRLKESAIRKISRDEMDLGELYDINALGEIRWLSGRKAEELGLFDDYEEVEQIAEPIEEESRRIDVRKDIPVNFEEQIEDSGRSSEGIEIDL